MSILKRFLFYFTWSFVSFLAAFLYMRFILGPKPESTSTFMVMFSLFYDYAFLHIGLIIGSIVFLSFFLLDIFYLSKQLKNNVMSVVLRLFIILISTVFVGLIHYMLEKVIDVI
jgi:hypothetical protein